MSYHVALAFSQTLSWSEMKLLLLLQSIFNCGHSSNPSDSRNPSFTAAIAVVVNSQIWILCLIFKRQGLEASKWSISSGGHHSVKQTLRNQQQGPEFITILHLAFIKQMLTWGRGDYNKHAHEHRVLLLNNFCSVNLQCICIKVLPLDHILVSVIITHTQCRSSPQIHADARQKCMSTTCSLRGIHTNTQSVLWFLREESLRSW